MDMIKVVSSIVSVVGYENRKLEVWLNTGKKYQYSSVPESVFESFLKAPSKGIFFNREVKPKYACKPLN